MEHVIRREVNINGCTGSLKWIQVAEDFCCDVYFRVQFCSGLILDGISFQNFGMLYGILAASSPNVLFYENVKELIEGFQSLQVSRNIVISIRYIGVVISFFFCCIVINVI